jgi:hypothetical protein
MCILSICQYIKVYYDEVFFDKYIMSKHTIAIDKISINWSASTICIYACLIASLTAGQCIIGHQWI